MKGKLMFLFAFVQLSLVAQQTVYIKQDTSSIIVEPMPAPFDDVEIEPEFVGGQRELNKFLMENIKYPEIAMDSNYQGRVYASFVVEEDGSVTNIAIKRGAHPSLDAEVLRLIGLMPKWKPGMINGKAVRSRFILPVNFHLE